MFFFGSTYNPFLFPTPVWNFSLDNFFVRAEREKIMSESLDKKPSAIKKDDEDKKSFEEVGRIVAQRWRNIEESERAKYTELAQADSARYKNEMKNFHNNELTMMTIQGRSSWCFCTCF